MNSLLQRRQEPREQVGLKHLNNAPRWRRDTVVKAVVKRAGRLFAPRRGVMDRMNMASQTRQMVENPGRMIDKALTATKGEKMPIASAL